LIYVDDDVAAAIKISINNKLMHYVRLFIYVGQFQILDVLFEVQYKY